MLPSSMIINNIGSGSHAGALVTVSCSVTGHSKRTETEVEGAEHAHTCLARINRFSFFIWQGGWIYVVHALAVSD